MDQGQGPPPILPATPHPTPVTYFLQLDSLDKVSITTQNSATCWEPIDFHTVSRDYFLFRLQHMHHPI